MAKLIAKQEDNLALSSIENWLWPQNPKKEGGLAITVSTYIILSHFKKQIIEFITPN